MAVNIRLKRLGTKKRPCYRIVVVDSRTSTKGKVLEEVGFYHPIEIEEKQLKFKEDRIRDWLSKGAKTTDTVRRLLNKHNFYIK